MEILYFLTIAWNTIDFQVYLFSSLYAIAFANLEQGRTATPSVSETISEV